MKDLTLDEMLEIAAQREAENEAIFKQRQEEQEKENKENE